ncbi:MAG: type II toxin-antitoxin system Phd/YefM family antitoxin [Candidatus Scalinduaceae bacterium]
MSIATNILKSPHVGIRDLKIHLSSLLKKGTLIVTERGKPVNVILPYSDMIELLDMLDEITDPETIKTIQEGRKAISRGVKGIPVSNVFKKLN